MELPNDNTVSKGHKPSHTAKQRRSATVPNTRDKEITGPNTKKEDEDVKEISYNKVKIAQIGKDTKHTNKSVLDRIAIVVATIAVFVALYPHVLSFVPSKPDTSVNVGPNDIQKLQKVTKELSERLSVLENELSTIKQFTDRTYHSASIDENLKDQNLDMGLRSLNLSVENHCCNISDLNVFVDSLLSKVKYLTENISDISIETLVLYQRTEQIADNISEKGSMFVVIMIDTILIVLIIVYLVESRKTTKRDSGIIESEHQHSTPPY